MSFRFLLCIGAFLLGTIRLTRADDLARLTVTPATTDVTLGKTAAAFTATMPAGTRYQLDSDLDWKARQERDQIVIEIMLPAGTRTRLETTMDAGNSVVRLVSTGTVVTASSLPPSGAAKAVDKADGKKSDASAQKKPALADEIAPHIRGLVSQIIGQPPGEVQFDPAARTDFAVPMTPAAAAIGSKSETIRPATPRQFGTEVLSKVGKDGKLTSGFAFATAPYLMFADVPLKKYREEPFERFLSRLQFSLAATVGDDARATSGARVSAALSGVIFDSGDPRQDPQLYTDLQSTFKPLELPGYQGGAVPVMPKDKIKAWSDAVDASRKRNWNAASMGFGYAPRWFSTTGNTDDLQHDGGMSWLSLAGPGFGKIKESTQFLGSVQYRHGERLPTPGNAALIGSANVISGGVQIRFGTPTFNGFAEAFYSRSSFSGGVREKTLEYELGGEKRLMQGLWLRLSVSESKPRKGESNTEVKSGFRYAFGDGPKLNLADVEK